MKSAAILLVIGSFLFAGEVKPVSADVINSKVLFPEREYVGKISTTFFKNINLTFPPISKIEFFVRTQTYYLAYIDLAGFVSKDPYFNEILTYFRSKHPERVEQFDAIKKELTIEMNEAFQKKIGAGNLEFYLMVLHALSEDFKKNELSGDEAFRLWNVLLDITRRVYDNSENTVENGAVLVTSSHLVFFKNFKKWQKSSLKKLKKVNIKEISDPQVQLILK